MKDTKDTIVALCVGDVIGEPGCLLLAKYLPRLKKQYGVDIAIVNGENSAKNGRGVTPELMAFFQSCGVQVITSGNHVWAKQTILPYFQQHTDLLRPANYPSDCPGKGVTVVAIDNVLVSVVSIQGRVFLKENLDCPFRTLQTILSFLKSQTPVVIVDFHAEATAEKQALAHFFDGSVSAILGTHTHVQTADARVLPAGTAYISDLGMVGAQNSIIGFKKDIALRGFLTQMPIKFEVEYSGPFIFNGVVMTINIRTGQAISIERISLVDNDLIIAK